MRHTTMLLLQSGKNRCQGITVAFAQRSEPIGITSAQRSRVAELASTTNLMRTIRTRTSPATDGSSIPLASAPYQTSHSSRTSPLRSNTSTLAHVYLGPLDARMEYRTVFVFSLCLVISFSPNCSSRAWSALNTYPANITPSSVKTIYHRTSRTLILSTLSTRTSLASSFDRPIILSFLVF